MKVYVIVGLYGAVIDEIEAFSNEQKADEFERKLCEEYEIPYDPTERQKRYDEDVESPEVHQFILDVDSAQ